MQELYAVFPKPVFRVKMAAKITLDFPNPLLTELGAWFLVLGKGVF